MGEQAQQSDSSVAVLERIDEAQEARRSYADLLRGTETTEAIATTPTPKTQEEYTVDQWKHELSRIIRRAAISRELLDKETLGEIKASVRTFESEIGLKNLLDSLTTQEFIISPKMAAVATELSRKLTNIFPEVTGVFILGSSIGGGAMIREATKSSHHPDVDWGLSSETELTFDERLKITQYGHSLLPDISKKLGLETSLDSCSEYTPLTQHITPMPTPEEFLALIEQNDHWEVVDRMLLYLVPTFPPEVGNQNRSNLFSALQVLRSHDVDLYQEIITDIFSQSLEVHNLRRKHFLIAGQDRDADERRLEQAMLDEENEDSQDENQLSRDERLVRKVVRNSADKMSLPLAKTLKNI